MRGCLVASERNGRASSCKLVVPSDLASRGKRLGFRSKPLPQAILDGGSSPSPLGSRLCPESQRAHQSFCLHYGRTLTASRCMKRTKHRLPVPPVQGVWWNQCSMLLAPCSLALWLPGSQAPGSLLHASTQRGIDMWREMRRSLPTSLPACQELTAIGEIP
jgi:hypothetical protein